jgi:hypothetical protein
MKAAKIYQDIMSTTTLIKASTKDMMDFKVDPRGRKAVALSDCTVIEGKISLLLECKNILFVK